MTIFDVLEIIKVLNFRMSRQRAGDVKMEGELLALTYGAVVARVLKDYEKTEEVNTQVRRSCKEHSKILQKTTYSLPKLLKIINNEL